jgi:hypothetical protein
MTGAADNSSCAQAALDYLRRGWSVVPVRPREKRPLVAWQPYQQAPPTAEEVRAWFVRWPQANVAIVTGAVSGLVVLDVDPKHEGAASLSRLEREHGPLPFTVEAVSGGGGRHLYFAHPGGQVHNRVALAPGIDLRGDGGVIVAPPSVHPSGARYAWRAQHAPQDVPLAPLPRWLLRHGPGESGRMGHPLAYWRGLIAEGVAQGSRNSTIASLAGHLLWHGVDADIVTELLLCWNRARCRPPLDDAEVVRTVESIARRHEQGGDSPHARP